MKQRSIGLCILLSFVTCGIYGLYWFVVMTNDVNEVSGEDGTSGGMALLLTIVTCGIYGWFWAYKMGEKVDIIKSRNGAAPGNSTILFLLLQLFGLGLINYAIIQDTLNKYGMAPTQNTGYNSYTTGYMGTGMPSGAYTNNTGNTYQNNGYGNSNPYGNASGYGNSNPYGNAGQQNNEEESQDKNS